MAGQRHINQVMRDLVSNIVSLHAKAEKCKNLPKRIMVGKASQVSNMDKNVCVIKNIPRRLRETLRLLPPT